MLILKIDKQKGEIRRRSPGDENPTENVYERNSEADQKERIKERQEKNTTGKKLS